MDYRYEQHAQVEEVEGRAEQEDAPELGFVKDQEHGLLAMPSVGGNDLHVIDLAVVYALPGNEDQHALEEGLEVGHQLAAFFGALPHEFGSSSTRSELAFRYVVFHTNSLLDSSGFKRFSARFFGVETQVGKVVKSVQEAANATARRQYKRNGQHVHENGVEVVKHVLHHDFLHLLGQEHLIFIALIGVEQAVECVGAGREKNTAVQITSLISVDRLVVAEVSVVGGIQRAQVEDQIHEEDAELQPRKVLHNGA